MLIEDQTYKTAENILGAAIGQHKVAMHGAAEPASMGEMDVKIAGAQSSTTFSERMRGAKAEANRESLSISIKPKFDLRAASETDVRAAVMETVKALMSAEAFKLEGGKTLADAYNWDQNNKQPEKADPKFEIVNDGKHNKMHLTLDLPAGATHWNVVDALAGKDVIKLKDATAQSQPIPADAPVLTQPVVGNATEALAKERTAAANQDQARGVA